MAEDQPVCDVMTDKALVQIPAKYAGKVVKLHYAKGEIAKVHSPLFQQEIAGTSTSAAAVVAAPVAAPVCAAKAACLLAAAPAGNGKALASPAVRRLARELSIDLSLGARLWRQRPGL